MPLTSGWCKREGAAVMKRKYARSFTALFCVGLLLLTALLLLPAPRVQAASASLQATHEARFVAAARLPGDINDDQTVDLMDAMILYRHVSGAIVMSTAQALAADIDENGLIDMRDARDLYCRVAGFVSATAPRPTLTTTVTVTTATTTSTSATAATTTTTVITTATTTLKTTAPTSATTTATTAMTSTTVPTTPTAAIGVDVSYSQGEVDWERVQAAGIDFAILRCGYGQDEPDQDDEQWERNTAECERIGMPYGAYFFCYARNEEEARGEAQHALRLLEGKSLTYPVYYDMEDSSWQGNLSNELYARIATVFCETLAQNGYKVGVYANLYWWEEKLTAPCFDNWYRWVAQYNDECQYEGDYQMWQYTETGTVDGIDGTVDMNECYMSFSSYEAAGASACLSPPQVRKEAEDRENMPSSA